MRARTTAILSMVLTALNTIISAPTASPAVTALNEDAIAFALERLDDTAAVELRNQKGKILACGDVISHSLNNGDVHLRVDSHSLHLPDCPKAGNLQTVDLHFNEIAFFEIVTPYDEFYLYSEKNWLHAHWTKPVKHNSAPFKELPAKPTTWRRYARPPKAIPGAFWPEVRLASGVYGMTRTQDMGITAALALEFRVHPALYRMGIFLELGHYSRLHNAYPDAISGHRLITANLGMQYAFWQREYFSIAATLSGGLVHYFYAAGDENGSGIRPTFGMGVIAFWHLLHNNRDRHKISLFSSLCSPLFLIVTIMNGCTIRFWESYALGCNTLIKILFFSCTALIEQQKVRGGTAA